MRLFIAALACLISVSVFGQSPCNNQTSITYQGYEYDIVEIGDQCWFAENCKYIPYVSTAAERSATNPYYYVYDYQDSDTDSAMKTDNFKTYGVLYNWTAVMTEGVCPSGWHIPTDGDWENLEIHLGMSEEDAKSDFRFDTNQGKYLKSETQWNGINSTGFNAIAGGIYSHEFIMIEEYCSFWTSSETIENTAWAWKRGLFKYDSIDKNMEGKDLGFSARCIKD